LKESYTKEKYDEEFEPTVLVDKEKPVGIVEDNDAIIFFNFRPDRMRQITKSFVLSDFDKFDRVNFKNLFFATMAEYEEGLRVEVAFQPRKVEKCLAEIISQNELRQLHVAETTKYAHVTFFLNGTKEEPFKGEDRIIVPSKNVSSFDQAPEMSARQIADNVVKEMKKNEYDFIVLNFANPDMVGHTGNLQATIKAVEVVDECLGKIVDETLSRDGVVFLTADHGNAEERINLRTGDKNKEHATNPVPFILIGKKFEGQPSIAGEVPEGDLSLMSPVGMLADVAPTILSVIGLEQPIEMEGQPLV
jgi:2,3-bisphosphoglycerate-independent phosphoglycerate mutase